MDELEKLKVENQYLKTIIDLIPANIYWIDVRGNCQFCNNPLVKIAGLSSKDEIIGQDPYRLMPKEIAKKTKEADANIMHQGHAQIFEEEGLSTEQLPAIYLTHKVPLYDEKNKVSGLVGISIDITDKKKAEKALEEARLREVIENERHRHQAEIRAMQEKMQPAEAMAGTIAHELRTPLVTIDMIAQVMGKNLPVLLDAYGQAQAAHLKVGEISRRHFEAMKEQPAVIQEEVHRSHFTINSLLQDIRAEKETPQDWGKYTISECLKEFFETYPFQGSERQKIHWDAKKDFHFEGSKLFLVHAIQNLVKNALWFVAKASKGDITIWAETDKHENRLYVKDTGTGIAKEVLPKLFVKFFSQRLKGTGLGLAFCKTAMQKMKGDIVCHSEEGKYTEFVLIFPKKH